MPDIQITQPIATLIGGGLAAVVVVIGWWVARPKRHNNWDSIKQDLDIANALPEDDAVRAWLIDYARLRVRLYGSAELNDFGWRAEVGRSSLIGAALATAMLAVFSYDFFTSPSNGVAITVLFTFLVPLALIAIATAIRGAVRVRVRRRQLSKLPLETRERLDAELMRLARDIDQP